MDQRPRSCVSANTSTQPSALSPQREGSCSICPANPILFTTSLSLLQLYDFVADSHPLSPKSSTPFAVDTKPAWCSRLNVRSVTLPVTACQGSRDGFLAHVSFPFPFRLSMIPRLRLFRVLLYCAHSVEYRVLVLRPCSAPTRSPCRSFSLGK